MKTFKLTDIIITPNRQRTQFSPKDIRDLADKIHASWNIQLPGVWMDEDKPVLVWGERRFRAITLLASEGKAYRISNGHQVPLGYIAVETLDALASPIERKEVELSENIDRVELPWPDRVRALAEIHALRQAANPRQTIADTAKEISLKTNIPEATLKSGIQRGPGASQSLNSIHVAVALAPHLDDADISRATSLNSAFALHLKKVGIAASAALINKRRARGALVSDLIELRHGDAKILIRDVPDKTVDLVLVDPPYGKNAHEANFSRRQTEKHTYDDDPTRAREFMQWLLIESFRVTKDRANLFMFFDSDHYGWLVEAAKRAAWSPFPRPLIWDKLSPGIGPWQDNGFGTSYEMIFFATKGRRGLHTTIRDVLPHKRVSDADKIHAAQKADTLLRQLIAISTIPGEMVFDPCAGSGSTLFAARALQRRALGFELDKSAFDAATSRLFSNLTLKESNDETTTSSSTDSATNAASPRQL